VLVKGLVGSTHPVPSAAVTVLATVMSAVAGRSAAGCALVAAAVLTGQVSIGWCNDLLDRHRDRAAGRTDKPLATGVVPPRLVAVACGLAATACVPLSLASGWRAGVAHLLGVAGGWAYDLGVKRTVWSWLPYAGSFALLTAFVTLGLPGHPAPPAWLVVAGALLGTGAHFLNVVPDVEADLAAGVRGLPQRLGAARAAVVGAVLLAAAVVVVTLGPGQPPWWAWAGLGVATACAAGAGVTGARRAAGRTPFLLAVLTAAVAVALLVARAPNLT
jgi:4-hydroxybenzoate polyprenyltransferase